MKSRVVQAIVIVVLFLVSVVLFSTCKNSETELDSYEYAE